MQSEIELKLDLAGADPDAWLAAAPGLTEFAVSRLDAVYFDTPDRALEAAGLSLRFRRDGGATMQTVKADGGRTAGLFVRPEWEFPVDGPRPVLDDRTPIRALLGDAVRTVEAVFSVGVERRVVRVRRDGAEIEVSIDRGRVVARDRESPLAEIELELKSGPAAGLFALAREIDAVVPARLGVLSKSERGYRLLEAARGAEKAGAVGLRPDMTAAQAFQAIIASCVRQYRLNEAILLAAQDADALHQVRVALRRLRSAFSIFKALADDPAAEGLRARLKDGAQALGRARDVDVMIEHLGDAAPDALLAGRSEAYKAVMALLVSAGWRATMLDLAAWQNAGPWLGIERIAETRDRAADAFAAAALRRLRKRIRKRGEALRDLADEARHEVRKEAKKLRYAADFFAALYPAKKARRRQEKFARALSDLQDRLGALNDLAAAPALLASLGIEPAADLAAPVSGRDRKDLLDKAVDAFEDFSDARTFWD